MKVALVIPPYDFYQIHPSYQVVGKNRGSGFGLVPGATHPLGLMYISAALKKDNHAVKIVDGVFHDLKEILKELSRFKPDLIGIQATSPLWPKSKRMARVFKKNFSAKIVVGGPHLNCAGAETISECNAIDFGAEGDGEAILTQLCRSLDGDVALGQVSGLAWKQEGKVIVNDPCPYYLSDLDEVLPDRAIIDLKQYCPSIGFYQKLPLTTVITSRGCRWNCSFCHESSPLRERSIDHIMEEIKEVKDRYRVREVIFYDQNMASDKQRLIELCQRLEDIDLVFGGNLRINTIDQEVLSAVKRAGFWRVFSGIESGVQKNLDRLNKGINLEEVKHKIKMTSESDLSVFGSFVYGIPGETYQEGLKTLELAKKLPLDFAKFMSFTPWPGSDIYKNPDPYGKVYREGNRMSMNKISFVPHSMEEEELRQLLRRSYREFYLRPQYMMKRVLKTKTKEEAMQNLRGFLSFVRA